jgi:hypothetical protein
MNFASLYGNPEWTEGGPNTAVAEASGPPGAFSGPAFFLISIIAVLVFVRILYELAD